MDLIHRTWKTRIWIVEQGNSSWSNWINVHLNQISCLPKQITFKYLKNLPNFIVAGVMRRRLTIIWIEQSSVAGHSVVSMAWKPCSKLISRLKSNLSYVSWQVTATEENYLVAWIQSCHVVVFCRCVPPPKDMLPGSKESLGIDTAINLELSDRFQVFPPGKFPLAVSFRRTPCFSLAYLFEWV